jgi:lycopene cyclase domain-containing protein
VAHLTYAAVLAACLLGTLPLEFALRARVYRRIVGAALAVLPVGLLFLAWDFWAAGAGWWWFDDDHLIGPRLGGLPLEEIAFFLVIPICGLLTIEGVRTVRPDWGRAADEAQARAQARGRRREHGRGSLR